MEYKTVPTLDIKELHGALWSIAGFHIPKPDKSQPFLMNKDSKALADILIIELSKMIPTLTIPDIKGLKFGFDQHTPHHIYPMWKRPNNYEGDIDYTKLTVTPHIDPNYTPEVQQITLENFIKKNISPTYNPFPQTHSNGTDIHLIADDYLVSLVLQNCFFKS